MHSALVGGWIVSRMSHVMHITIIGPAFMRYNITVGYNNLNCLIN